MRDQSSRRPGPPLDRQGLERLALHYAGRYATTRARLAAYLKRKLKERGWSEDSPPEIEPLVERFADLGYVDDRGFAAARAASLLRRGYGGRRIDQSLRAAGISEADGADARREAEEGEYEAALRFARRRRFGPFAAASMDPAARQKAFAAMVRAGHSVATARRVLGLAADEIEPADCD